MNILVTLPENLRKTFIPEDVAHKIEQIGNVIWNDKGANYTEEELREKIRDIDVCITGWGVPKFTARVLENANRLKLIAHTAGTVANFVSDELYAKGVRVVSANKVFAESVAEAVIGYLLAVLRDIPYYVNMMKSGGWKTEDFYNRGLLDQTVGLVGFGEIPRYLVSMLKPFRVKVKAFDKFVGAEEMAKYGVEKVDIEDIFASCPIISIHLPATQETYHMIDRRLLKLIQDDAILINTARGSVIDENALIEELKLNRFKVVLDVYEREPLPDDSPLRKMDNALLIPHMGGPTVDRRKYATLAILDDIDNFINNRPLVHEITAERAARMTR